MTRCSRWRAAPVLLLGALAACLPDRVTGPGPERIPPEVARALDASGVQNGVVAVAEGRDSTGAPIYVAGINVQDGDYAAAELAASSAERLFTANPSGGRATPGLDPTVDATVTFWCTVTYSDGRTERFSLKDVRVDSLVQKDAEQPSGGHMSKHYSSHGPKPAGTWSPDRGNTDGAGQFVTEYTANIASGDERIFLHYTVTEEGSPCKDMQETSLYRSGVEVRGLVPLPQNAGFGFGAVTSDHTHIYYVTPAVSTMTRNTAGFYTRTYDRTLVVTAGSLPWGGIADVNYNWRPPHSTHRIGTDLDIDWGGRSDDHMANWRRLIRAGQEGGGFTRCEPHNRNHVHCYAVLY